MSGFKKSISIQVPTKPYLKKYIEAQYGCPVNFTTKNYFGLTVALSLKKPMRNAQGETIKKMRFDSFTSSITIKAAPSFLTHYDYDLSINENQALTVNKLMEEKFEEDLYQFCSVMFLLGIETKEALGAFCTRYNLEIDEDIAFEALKKKEYRKRKEVEKNNAELSRERTKQVLKTFVAGSITEAQLQ